MQRTDHVIRAVCGISKKEQERGARLGDSLRLYGGAYASPYYGAYGSAYGSYYGAYAASPYYSYGAYSAIQKKDPRLINDRPRSSTEKPFGQCEGVAF